MGSAGPVVLSDVSLTLLLQRSDPAGQPAPSVGDSCTWVELLSWNAALSLPSLPTGGWWIHRPWVCAHLCSRDAGHGDFNLWHLSLPAVNSGAIGQVDEDRSSLITDVKGDKTMGLFWTQKWPIHPGNSTRNWDGQKVHLGFSQAATEKLNTLANPNMFCLFSFQFLSDNSTVD